MSYDDFEPWYSKAEQLYQVHGSHGEDPTRDTGASSTRPAVSHEPRIQQLSDDLTAAGYHPYHAPCGIMLDEAHRAMSTASAARGAMVTRAWCAKSDADPSPSGPRDDIAQRDAAREHRGGEARNGPDRTLRHGGRRDPRRRTGDLRGGHRLPLGRASNTAKILLSSANERHPNGLANGSDQVGRNYMFHNSKAVVALSKEPNDTVFQKTLAINDFYLGSDDYDWPVGQIQMVGKSNAEAMKGEEAHQVRAALEPRGNGETRRGLLAHDETCPGRLPRHPGR